MNECDATCSGDELMEVDDAFWEGYVPLGSAGRQVVEAQRAEHLPTFREWVEDTESRIQRSNRLAMQQYEQGQTRLMSPEVRRRREELELNLIFREMGMPKGAAMVAARGRQ